MKNYYEIYGNNIEGVPPFEEGKDRPKLVCLYGLGHLGLIVSIPTGIYFYNQVGGYLCAQEGYEGLFFVICESHYWDYAEVLQKYMRTWTSMTEEMADFVDSQLSRINAPNYLKVDRSRLNDSMEAWIHVLVDCNHPHFPCDGIECAKGVLTWENSD